MSSPMRAALLLLLTSTGCLFVGDVNGRPTAHIRVVSDGVLTLGAPIQLYVDVEDDQPGATDLLEVTPTDGKPGCVRWSPTANGWEVTVWDPGSYDAVVTAMDGQGAVGTTHATLTVLDAAPTVESALAEGSAPIACGSNWSASGPIPIVLGGHALNPQTLELPRPASCAPAVPYTSYTWTLDQQPTAAGVLGRATASMGTSTCPVTPLQPSSMQTLTVDSADDTADAPDPVVCLYPDPTVPASHVSTYGVSLTVATSAGDTPPIPLEVSVRGDAQACFDGSYPAAGAYVVPSDAPTVFDVVGADDSSAPGALLYTWTVTRHDGTSSIVQGATTGADGGSRFSFDPEILGVSVGESLRLRAEVVQPNGTLVCDDADDVCETSSCAASASTCPRRVTWSLELR